MVVSLLLALEHQQRVASKEPTGRHVEGFRGQIYSGSLFGLPSSFFQQLFRCNLQDRPMLMAFGPLVLAVFGLEPQVSVGQT